MKEESTIFEKIIDFLNSNGIKYELTEHEPVRTSEEAAKIRGVELKTGAKAMIIKSNGKYFLLVLPGDKQIDWKKIKKVLGVKDIRLATEEEAEAIAKVKMGSVPPFGNILELTTYVDSSVFENEYINFNPGSTMHSISIRSMDFRKITGLSNFLNESSFMK